MKQLGKVEPEEVEPERNEKQKEKSQEERKYIYILEHFKCVVTVAFVTHPYLR